MTERCLYIYYRVPAAHAGAAVRAVTAMQRQLRDTYHGLRTQLLRRPQESEGLQTWMETYTREGGVDETLQADIEQAAKCLRLWLASERHVEVFVPCV